MALRQFVGQRARIAVILSYFITATTFADTVSTSFETEPAGDFTLGISPITATFQNGNAQSVGNPALYVSGSHSWHVPPNTTAIVTFETPASEVSFFFRNAPGAGPSEARLIDVDGSVISTSAGTQNFINVTITRDDGETPIDRVEVRNMGNSGDVVVDNFTFTADVAAPGGPLDDPIPGSIPVGVEIELTQVADGLIAPNWATYAPGDATRLFIVDQPGHLIALNLATGQTSVFHDVSDRLIPLGEFGPGLFNESRGFLGAAFHPGYAANGLVYTYTSEPVSGLADFSTMPAGEVADHQTVITEWVVPRPLDPTSAVAPASAREILRIDQPQFNQNGGALEFDANGYLYIALGDGGGADDVDGQLFLDKPIVGHGTGNGKDPSNPLGAILRIDPIGDPLGADRVYAIPTTNPFFGQAGFVEEIFAYGFRNPFRISIDAMTGNLFAADVGQNDIEEVNIVTAGNNYGWNYKEGGFFFDANGNDAGFVTDVDPGVPAGLVDPVAQYDHDEGIAVIGGFVYRAGRISELDGRYVFGDFGGKISVNGRLFYLGGGNEITELEIRGQDDLDMLLLGFGRDSEGNVYVLGNATGTPTGAAGVVLRIDPGPGRLNFNAGSISVAEASGMVDVTVERSGGNIGPASVDYATLAGGATEGSDYTAATGTLDWADGETGSKSFHLIISDDTDTEGNESLTIVLSNATGAELGSTNEILVTITDNDAPPARSGGGALGISSLFALLMLAVWRARRRESSPKSPTRT